MKLLLRIVLLAVAACTASAAAATTHGQIDMLVFVSEGCPHCEAQKPFLEALAAHHDGLSVEFFELRHSARNRALFRDIAAAHGIGAGSVPTVFVGGRSWVGDSPLVRAQIASHVHACLERGDCPDSRDPARPLVPVAPAADDLSLNLPLLGSIDLMLQPLALATVLIAFIDGFNPCSIWVLTILLALVLHSGSRRRILIVGLTFLTVTATLYGLFITGVFGVLDLLGGIGWIHGLVALLAFLFAVVNIKDYFYFQRGLSFTIDEKHKPGIYRRIRELIREGRSTPALIVATAAMAAGIALIELPCTAGFPVLWSALVSSREIDWPSFAMLLALYLFIYLAIELVIFLVAVITMRVDRFEERHGRVLKLIGGMVMLALALVLVTAPELMNDLRAALAVFAAAVVATMMVIVLHRHLLPRIGVRIGDRW